MDSKIAYQLFALHKEHVASVRGININGAADYEDRCRVYYRAAHITILDLLLIQHREIHETAFSKLPGKQAFFHRILMKYQWPISQIKALSLNEVFLSLHEDLNYKSFDQEISDYFSGFLSSYAEFHFDDTIDSEWDPTLYQKIR
ncbi:hypothetical protein GJO14_06220 [Escherichia coli]|nr:hypothetical protein [Escherichia coli]